MTKTPTQVAEGLDEPLLNCVQNTAKAFHMDIGRDALVKGVSRDWALVAFLGAKHAQFYE